MKRQKTKGTIMKKHSTKLTKITSGCQVGKNQAHAGTHMLEFFSALLQTDKNCISQDGKNQAHAGTLQRALQEYHDIHSIFAVSTTTLRNDGQQSSQSGKIAYPHWLLRD